MTGSDGVLDGLRNPEYTGDNWCLPCTIANAVIALAVSVGLGLFGAAAWSTPVGFGVAVAALALSAALIALRGYLVPGTPTLTKRYLPERVLAAFERGGPAATPAEAAGTDASAVSSGSSQGGDVDDDADRGSPGGSASGDDGDGTTGVRDPTAVLLAADAIEEADDVDDLRLTDAFRRAWNQEIDAIREDGVEKRLIASALGVPEDDLTFDEYGNAFNARINGSRVSQWESRAAVLADLGARAVFEERYDEWRVLDSAGRGEVLYSLRSFLETCPACDGAVAIERDVVESCCRTTDVVAMNCERCDARLLEVEAP